MNPAVAIVIEYHAGRTLTLAAAGVEVRRRTGLRATDTKFRRGVELADGRLVKLMCEKVDGHWQTTPTAVEAFCRAAMGGPTAEGKPHRSPVPGDVD